MSYFRERVESLIPAITYESWVETIKTNDSKTIEIYEQNIKTHNEIVLHLPFYLDLFFYYEFHEKAYSAALKLFGMPRGVCIYQELYDKPCGEAAEIPEDHLRDLVKSATESEEEMELLFISIKSRLGSHKPCFQHSHLGNWANIFLDKAGVDIAYERFYFKTPDMISLFRNEYILNGYIPLED